jgi:hypothetical protein
MSQVELQENTDNVIIDTEGLDKVDQNAYVQTPHHSPPKGRHFKVKSIDKSNIIDYGKLMEEK